MSTHAIGGDGLERVGQSLPDETLTACLAADAVLLGAVGHPRYESRQPSERPEAGLLALRQALGGFANLRPAICHPALVDRTPFRAERLQGADILIVRELLGGIYFGEPRGYTSPDVAFNTLIYSKPEVERVARVAFEMATGRRRRVASIDKANVLETSRLWRTTVTEVARDFPDVALEHVYIDTCAMRLATTPASFDVILARQPVRRHPERSGGVDLGVARRAAVGHDRRAGGSLRAGSRLGARHRRPGDGRTRLAPLPAPRCCCGCRRGSRTKPICWSMPSKWPSRRALAPGTSPVRATPR